MGKGLSDQDRGREKNREEIILFFRENLKEMNFYEKMKKRGRTGTNNLIMEKNAIFVMEGTSLRNLKKTISQLFGEILAGKGLKKNQVKNINYLW